MTTHHYSNPSIEDDDDLIDPDDADLNDFDDPIGNNSQRQPLTGNIASTSASSSSRPLDQGYLTSRIPGEDRRAPQNTIDESVWDTLRRDLLAVWLKMREVLYPKYLLGGTMFESSEGGIRGVYANLRSGGLSGAREELAGLAGRVMDPESLLGQNTMSPGLRDWDLWGPLIFCLLLSFFLSLRAQDNQKDVVFSGVFAMIWIGEAVVTLQIKLLGGNISFAQSICIIGYTLFPLVLASLMSAFGLPVIARVPVYLVLVAWSLAAGVSILGGSGVVQNRVGIAVYPLLVFYLGLGCLCFIS
ncbi:protein YIPF6 [Microdochium nivale]|nr:protein YIPF6 [Microdochium nivale]